MKVPDTKTALPFDASLNKVIEDKAGSLGEVSELDPGKTGSVTLKLTPGKLRSAGHYMSGTGSWQVASELSSEASRGRMHRLPRDTQPQASTMTIKSYVHAVFVGLGVILNAICGGRPYQTLSCRIGESIRDDGWAAHVPWPQAWKDHFQRAIHRAIV